MMRLLHHVLAPSERLPEFPETWGAPPQVQHSGLGDALFSVLYSDVGEEFYPKCGPIHGMSGWEIRDPWSVVWNANTSVQLSLGDADSEGEVTLLEEGGILDNLTLKDVGHTESSLISLAKMDSQSTLDAASNPRPKTYVAVLPTRSQINFHIARAVLSSPGKCTPHDVSAKPKAWRYHFYTYEPEVPIIIYPLGTRTGSALNTLYNSARRLQ